MARTNYTSVRLCPLCTSQTLLHVVGFSHGSSHIPRLMSRQVALLGHSAMNPSQPVFPVVYGVIRQWREANHYTTYSVTKLCTYMTPHGMKMINVSGPWTRNYILFRNACFSTVPLPLLPHTHVGFSGNIAAES